MACACPAAIAPLPLPLCHCPAAIAPNPTCPALPIAPLQCLHKAIEICKPGTPYREIGDVISKHAKQHK